MALHFLAKDLSAWDGSRSDTLVLTLFSDERPLRGAAGLADWRLCGRLSRLIMHGRFSGKRGEILMMPPGRRLPFLRVMLFGLGPSTQFGEDSFRVHTQWIREVLEKAGVRDYALQPPGRATGLIAARRAVELWLNEEADDDEISIIDGAGAQKELADLFARKRAQKIQKKAAPGSAPAPQH